jgi:hypothetical protein
MRMISYLIADPLHLYKETMLIVMMITLSTVCRARRPGSRNNFHLLRDNRREGLAVNGDYLLDLIMSMGIIVTPSIYIVRIDIMLLSLGKDRNQDLWQEIPNKPRGDQQMVPGPSSPNTRDHYLDTPQDTESQLAKLAQEGGVDFINYLLAKQ